VLVTQLTVGSGAGSQILAHGLGDDCRQGLLGVDGVVLEVADELGRQVNVELPEVAHHASLTY
jgi:hypothetical protein